MPPHPYLPFTSAADSRYDYLDMFENYRPPLSFASIKDSISWAIDSLLAPVHELVAHFVMMSTRGQYPEAKVLPDPLPAPFTKPMTLVISLEALVDLENAEQRPGMETFLAQVSQFYEIVVWSEARPDVIVFFSTS